MNWGKMDETLIPNTRPARLQAISTVINNNRIRSQRELSLQLKNLGIEVAQPTLSRDLDDLSVQKDKAGYYILPTGEDVAFIALSRAIRDLLTTIEISEQLCVLRTPPGGAHLLASAIDHANLKGVLGTIAGDDTVLMIINNPKQAGIIRTSLLNMASNMEKETK